MRFFLFDSYESPLSIGLIKTGGQKIWQCTFNIKHLWHEQMPIQFSDMQDFFRNSFMSCFPPFYTTTIIQLSRCPYLQLITRSIILLFLHFIENSQNWQKLPMMIEFARATEWILLSNSPHSIQIQDQNSGQDFGSRIYFYENFGIFRPK